MPTPPPAHLIGARGNTTPAHVTGARAVTAHAASAVNAIAKRCQKLSQNR